MTIAEYREAFAAAYAATLIVELAAETPHPFAAALTVATDDCPAPDGMSPLSREAARRLAIVDVHGRLGLHARRHAAG